MSWLRTLIGIVALATLAMMTHPPSVLAIDVRSGPGKTYEVIANVPPGSFVAVAQEQDWYKIQLPDGREGWIHRFYAGPGQPPSVQEQPPSRTVPRGCHPAGHPVLHSPSGSLCHAFQSSATRVDARPPS